MQSLLDGLNSVLGFGGDATNSEESSEPARPAKQPTETAQPAEQPTKQPTEQPMGRKQPAEPLEQQADSKAQSAVSPRQETAGAGAAGLPESGAEEGVQPGDAESARGNKEREQAPAPAEKKKKKKKKRVKDVFAQFSLSCSPNIRGASAASEGEVEFQTTLLRIAECFVYRLPPRQGNSAYYCEKWVEHLLSRAFFSLFIALLVFRKAKGDALLMRLAATVSGGQPFAETGDIDLTKLTTGTAKTEGGKKVRSLSMYLEPVSDSSRYFALRVVHPKTKKATNLGIGFRERSSAFDLHAAIHDRIKMVHRQIAAVDQARRQQQQSLQWRATQALAPSTPAPAPASAPGAAENNPNEEDWDDFQAAAPAASLGAGGGGDEGGNGRQQQGGADWDEW